MTIPTDILAAILCTGGGIVVSLQAWILLEIINLKIKLANYKELNQAVKRHGERLSQMESHCGIELAEIKP